MDNKVVEEQAYFCHFSYISMYKRCDTPLHSMLRARNFTESTLCSINIFVMVDAQVSISAFCLSLFTSKSNEAQMDES